MFICNRCGERFWEPERERVRENLDGESGWWTHTEERCPFCGDEDIEEEEEEWGNLLTLRVNALEF